MKLPPIEYFYGNTPMSLWIRRCKPFVTLHVFPSRIIHSVKITPELIKMVDEINLSYLKLISVIGISKGKEGDTK